MNGGRDGKRLVRAAFLACAMGLGGGALDLSVLGAEEALILTQAPRIPATTGSKSSWEELYPVGTRLVLSKPPFAADHVRIVSEGIVAAGSPVVAYGGRHVVFAGKADAGRDWQVYEARLDGGRPRALTAVPGGATHPALLPHGGVVFSSPAGRSSRMPQIYAQARGGEPQQLTFAPNGATDPTMLLDGRILFVSGQPSTTPGAIVGSALYTVNNDGTELTAFACQHDSPRFLWSPRQLNDGRVAFLVSGNSGGVLETAAECVRMARPFASRSELLPEGPVKVRSVQPAGESNLLLCAEMPVGPNGQAAWACFRVSREARSLGAPLFVDPAWNTIEAVEAAPSTPPMGRISTMEPSKRTGQLLCLDINDTSLRSGDQPPARATRVRLTAGVQADSVRVLGEVDVQPDGSFMAEVPADIPLGFEALDEHGQVIRREPPTMWVRGGENRACVGCHAAHNRSPHNHRPLAVRVPPPRLCDPPVNTLAGKSP